MGGQRLQRDPAAAAAGVRRPRASALGFEPSYSMHPIIASRHPDQWLSCPRRADFSVDVDAAAALVARARARRAVHHQPEQPDRRIAAAARTSGRCCEAAPGHRGGRRGVRGVLRPAQRDRADRPVPGPSWSWCAPCRKAFAFAGGRLGLPGRRAAVIDALLLVRLPYHLSTLTQAAALGGAAARRRHPGLGGARWSPSGSPGRGGAASRLGFDVDRFRRQLPAVRPVRRSRSAAWRPTWTPACCAGHGHRRVPAGDHRHRRRRTTCCWTSARELDARRVDR